MKVTKRQIATVAGVVTVGSVGAFAIKKVLGAGPAATTLGTLVLMGLHDKYDGPVGNWIYKQL